MAKIVIDGKEISLNISEEELIKFLELKGAERIDPRMHKKSFEDLSVDSLTIGVEMPSNKEYAWFSVTNKVKLEIKNAIRKDFV